MTDDAIAASSVALARLEHLAASAATVADARGVASHALGPGLVAVTLPGVDLHWRRLYQEGALVLDVTRVDGHVRCDSFVPGPWLALLGSLARPGGPADASRHDGRGRTDGRVPKLGARSPARRAAIVDLAALVVGRGEEMAADPGIRVGRLGVHFAAVGHVAGLVPTSVHTSRGMEIFTAAVDRSWPHPLRRTRGLRNLVALSQVLSLSSRVTDGDRLAFHEFCEGGV